MKSTEYFERAIKNYLDQLATDDSLFATVYGQENKSIKECCNYILSEVYKSGSNGFHDDEIFGMAVHYFQEKDIKIDKIELSSVQVMVNHTIELTEDEKKQARINALEKLENENYHKLKTNTKKTKRSADNDVKQLSIFQNEA